MSLVKEIIARWRSPTPEFWKKIRGYGIKLCGVGLVMGLMVPQATNWFVEQITPYKEGITFVFYDWYYSISISTFVIGLLVAGLSNITVTNNISEWVKPPIDLKGKDDQSDTKQQ